MASLLQCRPVFLYAPNLVGYFRLCLLAGSLLSGTRLPEVTLGLLCTNLVLDGLDGYLARRRGQVSCGWQGQNSRLWRDRPLPMGSCSRNIKLLQLAQAQSLIVAALSLHHHDFWDQVEAGRWDVMMLVWNTDKLIWSIPGCACRQYNSRGVLCLGLGWSHWGFLRVAGDVVLPLHTQGRNC